MADNKLATLFNKVDLAGLASAGSAPVNIGKYKQSLNEEIYAQEAAITKPYDYDGIDWSKDWVTDFQVKRNEINYQTRLGDIIQQLEDLDNIDKAKRYIDNQKEISKYLNALREDPSKLEYKLQALNIAKQNDIEGLTDAYNKVVVNKAGGLDNQKIRLEWLENETKSKVDGYLKEAYEYKDNAEYWKNKHKISDYYLAKQLSTSIDFTNPDTYLFRTSDLMGSSASSWKSQIAGTVGAAIASSAGVAAGAAITAGSGGVAAPLGIAIAGAGISVASNIYSRSEESKAEVFSNYKSRVFNNADNAGITDKVLENAKKLLIAANKNNPNYELPSDDEIKDKILVGELKSGNEKFDDIRIKSLKGLDNLYTQNMALSGWDITANVLQVMPIGILAKGSKAIKIASETTTIGKITSKATGLKGAISKRIDDVITAGIERVPSSLPRITKRRAIASIAGRTVLMGIGEGAEEGTQYIRGKEYERGAYDDREDNYLEAIVGNVGVGARSVFAALTPFDSAYSSDKEFLDNFKGGALLGGLTTAVVSPLAAYKPLKDKIRAEELVSKLYADRFAERDAISKSEFYAEAAKNNKAANVYDAFEELKKMNIEGVDLDVINAELERANRIINLASSRQIKELAIKNNIDPKSDDYNTFVALYDHHTELVKESIKNLSTTSTEVSKILQRQDVNEFAELKNKENPELVKRFAYLQALKKKLEQLSKKYADDIALAEEKSKANGVNIPTQDLHENKKIVDGMLKKTNKDINFLRGKELNEEDSREEGNVKPNSDTVGGSPVALEYLLEGGKGSIESAGYFLHGVAAAFPDITNDIEAIRNNIDSNTLGLNPSLFVTSNHNSISQIEALISSTYGKPGLDIYRELLNNSTGFYSRDGKVISNKIESLQPINSSSTINIINKYQTNSNEEDSANFNINDYEIPTAHADMAKAVEAMIYSNIDNVRNLKGLLNFVTPESEGKGKAKESVDKYKETVKENELVIQDLNDAARGNIPTQEQAKEEVEVKLPVVEPLSPSYNEDSTAPTSAATTSASTDPAVDKPVIGPVAAPTEAEPKPSSATTEKEDKPKGDTVTSTTEIKDGVRKTVYKKYNSDGKLTGGLRIEKEDISKTELEAIEDALDGLKDYTFELLKFNKYENGKMSGIVRVRGTLIENGIYVADNYEFKFDKDFSGKTEEETAAEPISKPSKPLSTEKATTAPSGSSVVENDKITINFKDPSDPAGAEIQLNFDLIDIPYESKRDGSGKAKMIDIASRKIVLVNINGIAVPFYCSTGKGGKAGVASGKWYPFFGIGNDGWMNKGTESQINSYYGNQLLKLISEQLDRLFGDVSSKSDIPMSTIGEDISIEEINKNLNPTINRTPKTIDNLNKNVDEVKSKLDAYLLDVASKSKELQKETEAPELTELRNQIKAAREATTTTTKVPNKYKRRGIQEDQLYSVKVEPNLDTSAGRAFENANTTLKEIFDVALYSNDLALKVNNSEYRVFPKKDPYNADIFYNELSKLLEVDLFGELYLLLHDARFKLEEAVINLNTEDINKYTDEVNTILASYDSLKRLIAELDLKANEEATEPFAADKQPEVPVVTTDDVEAVALEPVVENIPAPDNVDLQEVNKPLVMDRGLDKWSRQLTYFTPANTKLDGYDGYESGAALGEALMNPDFLATADVSIVVKPYTNKTTNVTEQAVYIEFKYKGKNYVAALHSDKYNFNNIKGFRQLQYEKQLIVLLNLKALREKIIKLNEIVKNNPNYKIVPTSINKTNGVINSVVDKEGNPVNTNLQDIPLFNINNIYDITPENTPIGIATGPLGSEVIRVGGKDLYANGKQLGAAYYMLPVNVNGKTFDIPIRLNTKPFKGDNAVAELILKLVTDLNNPNYTTADGEVTPFSHFGLLKLIVNFGSHTATNPELYTPDQARERMKKQFYIDKDDSEYLVLGQDQYRLADLVLNPDGTPVNKVAYDKAKQYIMDNFHWSVEEDNLWKWFAGENTLEKGHPLGALKAWFQINDKLKLTIIPGELEFTKDDVTANGSGISMVGWYIKNNILTSNLNPKMPFKNPNIYMLDVMLVNDTENKLIQAATEKIEKEVAKVEEAKETGADSAKATDMTLDDIFADLGPNYGIAEPVANNDGFINKENATNYLNKTLGLSEDDVIFVPTIIEITSAGFYVLGRASLDSITLSEQAPAGVEYHEAWHRVSNLLISENKRKKIFKRINKDGRMTEAEIDEMLAEQFRDFMNYALNKIDFETTNWFRKIYNFIKILAKVGNYRLAKMYYDINVGKFRNVKPSTENVERFKRIYENGPDFKHRGTNYASIRGSESYNTMISSLFYALLRMNFGNIYNVRYEDLSKLDFEVLRTLVSNQYTKFNKPAMKEILDNFDNDIAPAISDLIAKLGGSVKLEIEAEEQSISDIEGGETEAINVGEHTKASYETSMIDKAPYKIKFFFKTVPAYVFDEANNKITVATDPITGLPRFVDSGMAWKMALNKLHDVRSVSDMINRINQLSQTDRFFLAVAIKLNQLDPIKDEQFITKLYTIIRSSKHEFLTGKITTLPNKKSKVDIIDNTVDVRAIAYPKIWSQMLFYNSAIFRVAEDGVVYADVDALLHLRKVRDRFYKIYEAFISGKGKLTLGDKQYDFTSNLEDQERLKKLIVMLLNEVGVAVDLPTIANMMSSGKVNGYSDPLTSDTYTLLKDFITSGKYSLKSLFDRLGFIASSVKENGSIDFVQMGDNKIDVRQFYNESGFIKALAQSYAKIHAGSEDLKSLGASNNILYPISLNNFVFDRVSELNEDALVVNELNDITYNKGSLMLNQLASRRKPKVSAETLVNFRTDDVGDQGRDYFQVTDREDYIMKMSLVMSDRILFPTIADKKTYHVLNGFKLPHERITWEKVDGGLRPTFGSETIAQFMAYANAELATIEQTLNDLDPNNPNRIPNDKLIKNYHTPVEYKVDGLTYYVSPNGTRFRFLTGIYIVVNGKELFIDFNAVDKSKTPEQALQKARLNLQLAKDYFFNSNIDGKTKADFISTLIAKAVEKEINKAAELGLILKLAGDNIYGLRNSLLDNDAIETRTSHYENLESAPAIVKTNAEGYAVYDAIADYAVNSIISINEVERIFSGDPAFYKWAYTEDGMVDNTVDKIKRLGSVTSTGTNNRLDFEDLTHTDYTVAELNDIEIGSKQFDTLEQLFIEGNIRDAVGDNENSDPDIVEAAKLKARAEVGGYKDSINIADAAVYVSPTMYRNMMRMIGEWSPEIEEAFLILTNPETELSWYDELELYRKVTKASLKPLKYMAFGFRTKEQQGLGIPYFNKMALFPVFKTIATGDMADLYERMTATGKYSGSNPIDMVMFNSAVKVGSRAPKDYYANGDTDVTDLNKLTVYKQPFKYLRQQLATDPHVHEELMAGTQFLKVGLSNIDPKAKYGNDTLGYMLGELIANSIFNYMNILSDIGKLEIYDKLFDLSGNLSIEKLGKMLSDDAKQSDMNDNVIDALLVIDGKFKLPLSAISGTSVDNRFISMLNKSVIDIHLPGGSFIQRSSFGIKAGEGLSVISDKYLNGGKRLKLLNKDGSMDAIVSINLFKHIIPGYNKMTFSQAKKWLIDNNIIGENAEPNAIGYRIPTQSIASISPLKFVDVLPEVMGDTVVLPDEFTKLTGSDFDIDKLYIARYQYKNGSKKGLSETDTIKNAMLEMYMRILTTVSNTNQLKASIDTATGGVKAILKDVERGRKLEPIKPFMSYLPSFQEDKKSEYTKGKSGIGPMALNNAHHVMTQLLNCRFKSNSFVNALGIRDLNKVHDDASLSEPVPGRILDWLSAMINAFVDIAKDPYIVRLNVNDYTYNMISLLLRTGKGKQSFYFLSQPILKDIAIEVAKNKGRYGVDLSKTNAQLERDAIDTVLRKYDPSGRYIKEFRAINYDNTLMADEYADLFTEYTKPDGTITSRMRELLLMDKDDITQGTSNYARELIRIYFAFKALKPYADELANLVKYSKIDTKKMGNTFAQQRIFAAGIELMKKKSLFEPGDVSNFFDKTFLQRKYENSILFGSTIFNDVLLTNTKGFLYLQDIILQQLGRSTNATEKITKPVINALSASIKSGFFNERMKSKGLLPRTMFYGDDSMAKRLLRIKNNIQKGMYEEFKDGNTLLDFLLPNIVVNSVMSQDPDLIDTSSIFTAENTTANDLINSWLLMLESDIEEVRLFADDLVDYAFITSGDNKNPNSFFEYFPNDFRLSIGYADYVSRITDLYAAGQVESFNIDDIYLNNWYDDALVKRVPEMYYDEDGNIRALMTIDSGQIFPGTNRTYPLVIFGKRNNEVTKGKIGNTSYTEFTVKPTYSRYIKVKIGKTNNPESWAVYKLVGVSKLVDEKNPNKIHEYPVYQIVNKKGYKYRGHTITEYGRNDWHKFNILPELYDFKSNMQSGLIVKHIAGIELMNPNYWSDLMELINGTVDVNDNNAAIGNKSMIEEEIDSIDDVEPSIQVPTEKLAQSSNTHDYTKSRKTYSGMITQLEPNQIFVFGSNTQGRHGKGAALTARNKFGAVYGLAEGIQGNSYGIITKDLTKTTHPSRTVDQIKEQISNLYEYASLNPNKEFLVAYSGTGSNLNAYSNKEMADMFSSMPIPNNVIFEENFDKLLTRNKLETTPTKLSGLDLVDMYVAAEKRLREELTQLGLSEADITAKFNEFAAILRNNNINTQDAIWEALRKYICNL